MRPMEVWDSSDGVFLTLSDVLAALPPACLKRSWWEVGDYFHPHGQEPFCLIANSDDALERIANTGHRESGRSLLALARSTSQVIWGTFRGYDPVDAAQPWITLHAIDSTLWRIDTADGRTRQAIIKAFNDVRQTE